MIMSFQICFLKKLLFVIFQEVTSKKIIKYNFIIFFYIFFINVIYILNLYMNS